MKLKMTYDSLDELPKEVHALYTEKDGKFQLTGVEGMKTQADIDRIQAGALKEREEHKKTKERYKPFESFVDSADEVIAKLDKYGELEAAASGKIDDTKINEMVETRIKTKLSPMERQAKKDADTIASLQQENETLKGNERRRIIKEAVRKAAIESKMVDTAVEDAEYLAERLFEVTEDGKVLTKDGVGVTPGVDAMVWLSDMQPKRPHWWPTSQGGGGKGSGKGNGFSGANPFTKEGWNMTEQGRVLRENPARAEQLARAAGTTVGGAKPT